MRKLLFATSNSGKIKEYKEIFRQLKIPVKIISLRDLNIKKEVKEDGRTFKENAIKKVKFYSKLTDLPVLADDGGLEIDFLKGEPGVKSRRWPGYEASDKELVDIALDKLKGLSKEKRKAHLRMVLAFLLPNKKIYTFEGKLRGRIVKKPSVGKIKGFPFRRIFYVDKYKKIYGKLSLKEETKIGHRKKAVKKALPVIKKYLCST